MYSSCTQPVNSKRAPGTGATGCVGNGLTVDMACLQGTDTSEGRGAEAAVAMGTSGGPLLRSPQQPSKDLGANSDQQN